MVGESQNKSKFLLAGLVVSVEFQRARLYIERLCLTFPNLYEKPDIRPLLNLDWCLYLRKIRRRIGGRIWALQKDVVVFLNGEYLGDDTDLFQYVLQYARIRVCVDFHSLGCQQVEGIINKSIENGKRYAYFSISVEGINVGTMLFMLYYELVPKTSEIFLKRCKSLLHGWRDRPIHRIVKNCWIQGGGFDLRDKHLPCENYVIPHDRRGILSMCNSCKHVNNTTQFIISLDSTPWMDYKYVAFGQLVQGEETLRKIEAIDTRYQSPRKAISITYCGEYSLDSKTDPNSVDEIEKYYENGKTQTGLPVDIGHEDDIDSNLSETRYDKGDYCLDSDLKTNEEAMQLPSYLIQLYMEQIGTGMDEEEQAKARKELNDAAANVLPDMPVVGMDMHIIKQLSLPIPIIQSIGYQSKLKINQSNLREQNEGEDHIESKEVVQQVIELDTAVVSEEFPKLTSSQRIDEEEVKTMFV